MKIILGINAFHGDSSACLLVDGKLVAAAEEERFRRIKHWAGFPSKAIEWCLSEAKIDLVDVNHICINQDKNSSFLRKVFFVINSRPSLKMLVDRFKKKKKRSSIKDYFKTEFSQSEFQGTFHFIDHHLAHLSSAFHVSSFDESVVVSVDGFDGII